MTTDPDNMNDAYHDPLPDDVIARLLDALAPADGPSAALKARVMQRIVAEGSANGITTVRAGEGEWLPFIPGVAAKVLHDDGRVRTWLARLEAGARVPPHMHDGDEEILMLEGACIVEGIAMQAGDYQFSPSGSAHGEMSTAAGCMLLLRTKSPAAEPA